ncbi:MAG: hypothetical protein AB7K24_22795 [Gemmataceae bacterium]
MVRKRLVVLALGLGFVIGCANSCRVPLLGRRFRANEECPCMDQGGMMTSDGPVLIEGGGPAVSTQPVPAPTPIGPPPRLVPAPMTQPPVAQPQPYVPQKRQRSVDE